jgi:hypothetical protein
MSGQSEQRSGGRIMGWKGSRDFSELGSVGVEGMRGWSDTYAAMKPEAPVTRTRDPGLIAGMMRFGLCV